MKGRFIVLDGPDGSGKTTQAQALCANITRKHGIETLCVREPGGTAIGEAVRGILLDKAHSDMTPHAELLLFMASRAQLVRTVIAPALDRGVAVVADRFLSASVAYQGAGGGLGVQAVSEIGRFAIGGVEPDLVVILDVPPEVGLRRRGAARDLIESRALSFHEAVRRGFLDLAASDRRYRVLDATMPAEQVFDDLARMADSLFAKRA